MKREASRWGRQNLSHAKRKFFFSNDFGKRGGTICNTVEDSSTVFWGKKREYEVVSKQMEERKRKGEGRREMGSK